MKKLYRCCAIFSIMLMLIAGSAGASFSGEYQAFNQAHGLDAGFTREGIEVSPRTGTKGLAQGLQVILSIVPDHP